MYQSERLAKSTIITHGDSQDFDTIYNQLKQRILDEGDKADSTAIERFQILEELSKFNFGKFLIINNGINGYWTRYMVLHPQEGRLSGVNDAKKRFSKFENWLLDRCPIILATQERFFNFQRLLQSYVQDNVKLASLPCGLMDDLLGLNFRGINNFTLVGIDLDENSLKYANENAKHNHLEKHCHFEQRDAWQLEYTNEFDVITSNGLNFYEPNDEKVTSLYHEFYQALKTGGKFISSFLTPPPNKENISPWDMTQINKEDLKIQKILLSDILKVRWQNAYRTEEQTLRQLTKVGFKDVLFIYDRQKMFPTFIASK